MDNTAYKAALKTVYNKVDALLKKSSYDQMNVNYQLFSKRFSLDTFAIQSEIIRGILNRQAKPIVLYGDEVRIEHQWIEEVYRASVRELDRVRKDSDIVISGDFLEEIVQKELVSFFSRLGWEEQNKLIQYLLLCPDLKTKMLGTKLLTMYTSEKKHQSSLDGGVADEVL